MARAGRPPAAVVGASLAWLSRDRGPLAGASGGAVTGEITGMGSVIKKRRKRMAKKKHRKLLRKTRVQRRKLGK